VSSAKAFPTPEDRWAIMRAYFKEKGLVSQQLESYNKFVTETMQKLIEELGEVEPFESGYKLEFIKIRYGEERGHEARNPHRV